MSALSPKAEARDIELAPTQGRSSCLPSLRQGGFPAFHARKPRRCLETGSLLPPLAAHRLFPQFSKR